MKSILLAVLMVSMSLSVGLVELNKAPWLVEDAESELGEANTPMHKASEGNLRVQKEILICPALSATGTCSVKGI